MIKIAIVVGDYNPKGAACVGHEALVQNKLTELEHKHFEFELIDIKFVIAPDGRSHSMIIFTGKDGYAE